MIMFAPFVNQNEKEGWESYEVQHQDWISQDYVSLTLAPIVICVPHPTWPSLILWLFLVPYRDIVDGMIRISRTFRRKFMIVIFARMIPEEDTLIQGSC